MIIGYARTSTIDQNAGFKAQLKEATVYRILAAASKQKILSLGKG
jgi:DNA invertase Pin-like site-specific DNA recombinase